MKKILVVLAIAALVAPVTAQAQIFGVTGDGSFDAYRSGSGEGYSNGGGSGTVRLQKANQNYGWLSFYGAVADGTGQSLASYLAANPGAKANLYVRMTGDAMPAGNNGSYLISIRSGNTGPMVEDQGGSSGFSTTNVAPGYAGASELQAFAGCATYPTTTFPNFGDGIYTGELPANGGGTPWITPSTRVANTGATPYKVGAGASVAYDKGLVTTGTANGKFIGYFNDTSTGGGLSLYALEDVLGLFTNKALGVTTNVQAAGQIMNGGFAAPTLVNSSMLQNITDPRNGLTDNWMVIPVDAAFLADMANPENKGFIFDNHFTGLTDDFTNPAFYTKEQSLGNGKNSGAYLMIVNTPEPCTMILVALGGLALLRRRVA